MRPLPLRLQVVFLALYYIYIVAFKFTTSCNLPIRRQGVHINSRVHVAIVVHFVVVSFRCMIFISGDKYLYYCHGDEDFRNVPSHSSFLLLF